MTDSAFVGRTVALWGCKAWHTFPDDVNRETVLSGLFDIDEYLPTEPSNYVWEPGFLVYSENQNYYFVDAMTLWAQVDPQGFGDMQRSERELAIAMDTQDELEEIQRNR